MKKVLLRMAVVALCTLTLCFTLTACSGGGGADAGKKMVGYWELESGKSDTEEITAEDVAFMKTIGVQFVLHLAEDGTGAIDIFGDVENITWDMNKATLSYDGATCNLKLDGDTLVVSDNSMGDLNFKKGDDTLKQKIEDDRKAMGS